MPNLSVFGRFPGVSEGERCNSLSGVVSLCILFVFSLYNTHKGKKEFPCRIIGCWCVLSPIFTTLFPLKKCPWGFPKPEISPHAWKRVWRSGLDPGKNSNKKKAPGSVRVSWGGDGSPRYPDTNSHYFSITKSGSRDRILKVERILLYDREKRVRRGSVFIDKLPL